MPRQSEVGSGIMGHSSTGGGIGFVLAGVAIMLSIEIKGLLIGEGADQRTIAKIRELVRSDPSVEQIGYPLTMYFGPRTVLLALDVQFRNGLRSEEIAEAIDRLEKSVRNRYPDK